MKNYRCLGLQHYEHKEYILIPIRFEDRFLIMQWRNEQIYHLRQNKLITEIDQNNYFNDIIAKEFNYEKPNQILFSFLKNGICIGYGGLVHINYIDKNAEISFIMDTSLEAQYFECIWLEYLGLIQKLAFKELKFHKLFTYAFDIRKHLYPILLKANFYEEARLKNHCYFDNKYIDVVIHSKLNSDN